MIDTRFPLSLLHSDSIGRVASAPAEWQVVCVAKRDDFALPCTETDSTS